MMTVIRLDAQQLYLAMLAGCHAVIREREYLNTINIFPIQDGDTGDNMAATANAVIHYASLKESIKDTLQSVAHASMTGARGNSGMIFSQFFNALADFAKHEEEALSMQSFGELLSKAAKRVRTAILNPIDGTMLTIMEHWSAYTHETAPHVPCFKSALQNITVKLSDAVTQTTQALAALKAANVVDAGALGFFHFVSGFSRYIADPLSHTKESLESLELSHSHVESVTSAPEDGRYCTEAMIVQDCLNQTKLIDILKKYGSSVVLSANAKQCRFHVHTDTPWDVFNEIQEIGKIHNPKVDDMLRQYEAINTRKYNIALVTDSNVDVPKEYCDEHQIHILPLNVHIEGHDLLDKYSIQPAQFYEKLNSYTSHPKTSSPSSLVIEQKLRPLAEKYEHVIFLSLAQSLSSTHDAIKHVAKQFSNVHVINSKCCSGAQGLLLMDIVDAIEAQQSLETILAYTENLISKTQFCFMINDMSALIRSGRINKFIGKMAKFSGLKPIFSLNSEGKAHLVSKAFNEKIAMQKILQQIKERIQKGEELKSYCLIHANAPELVQTFATEVQKELKMPASYIESASVTVGVHAGSGCVGIAALFL